MAAMLLASVFIDNLPLNMTPRWLGNIFNNCGKVLGVFIPSKRRVASGSRFGFVRYGSKAEADLAVGKLNGTWFLHHQLSVQLARPGGSTMNAFSEGLILADKSGLNPQTLLDVLDLGGIANPMFRMKGPTMIRVTHLHVL